jgi:DNA polymerase kappa
LTIVQRILEEACFNFTKVWLPAVLERNGWDCAEAVELTQWSKIFSHESANLPQHAIATGTESISNMLLSTYKIRHTVVHRLPITARGAIQLIEPAIRVTEVLQDSLRASQLQELQKEVDSRIDAMELSKNVLEDNVSRELDEIRLQRQMLDEKEKEIVANMFKEDDDNKSLIGTLIEESINRIFSEEGELQQTLEDQEPGSEGRSGVDLILRRST